MQVDFRGLKHPEPLKKIRTIIRSMCTRHVDVKVMIDTCDYGKIIKMFADMTGCKTKIEQREGYCMVIIEGDSCKCT
jgi:hypothetical protein